MTYTRKMLLALSAAVALGTATALIAQDAQTAPPPPQGQQAPAQGGWQGRGGRQMDPSREARHMAKRLNLSGDQESQVKSILQNAQQQMETLRANSALAPQDRRAQMMSIHQTSKSQIRALLNDDQKAKFDAMAAEREQRMQEKREQRMGGGNGDATPPPAAPGA